MDEAQGGTKWLVLLLEKEEGILKELIKWFNGMKKQEIKEKRIGFVP
jgi:hypothetical protein